MFSEYVEKAMRKASYEIIEDGTFCGSIPGFEGLWSNGTTLEECREDLKGALEGWLVLGLWLNDESIPRLGKLDLVPRKLVMSGQRKHEPTAASRVRKAS